MAEPNLPPYIPAGGEVHFPETPEDEAKRVGEYFETHPVPTKSLHDTYGDEDSSIPDFPMGDR